MCTLKASEFVMATHGTAGEDEEAESGKLDEVNMT